jgi:hypothetical protein
VGVPLVTTSGTGMPPHGRERRVDLRDERVVVGVVEVAVVGVQAAERQRRRRGDPPGEPHGLGPGGDPGAVHADVEVEEHVDRDAGGGRRPGEVVDADVAVDEAAEAGAGEPADELGEPGGRRAHHGIREQHVDGPGGRRHLHLGDRGSLELANALGQAEPDDLGHLVGLHVRPQPLDAPRSRRHTADVLLDPVRVDEERGRRDVGRVRDLVPGTHRGIIVAADSRPDKGRGRSCMRRVTTRIVGGMNMPLRPAATGSAPFACPASVELLARSRGSLAEGQWGGVPHVGPIRGRWRVVVVTNGRRGIAAPARRHHLVRSGADGGARARDGAHGDGDDRTDGSLQFRPAPPCRARAHDLHPSRGEGGVRAVDGLRHSLRPGLSAHIHVLRPPRRTVP